MRLRPLSEEECYCRCYGGADNRVKLLRAEPVHERDEPHPASPRLRLVLERERDLEHPRRAA